MFDMRIGGQLVKNITSFKMTRTHGLSEIIGEDTTHIIYKGFYNGNYFELEEIFDYGNTDYELLVYKENYKDVYIDEELTELSDFCSNKEVIRAFKDNIICEYGRLFD